MILSSNNLKYISKVRNSVYEKLKVEFLFHSNHLEGSTFSIEALEKLLQSDIVLGNHSFSDIVETRNSLEVFDYITSNCSDELTKFWIFEAHRILKRGTSDEEIGCLGRWKLYDNRLSGVDIKTARVHEVDSMMFNLICDWNESDKTLSDIATFHYKFERIHPFQDGNGRIGRFIIFKQCIESGIDLIAIDSCLDDEYRSSLYSAQKTDDVSSLISVFRKCQERLDSKFADYDEVIKTMKSASDIFYSTNK